MNTRSPLRRIAQLAPALCAAAALAIGGGTVAVASSSHHHSKPKPHKVPVSPLAGTWAGQYSGAFSGTFTLNWKLSGSNLGGWITLSYPSGKYTVNGSVHGSAITFGAVGAGATYTGTVSGKSMSGNYMTPKGGGSWSAHKTS